MRKKLLTVILYEIKKLGGLIKTMDKSHENKQYQLFNQKSNIWDKTMS
ncbi:hypothetical protein FOC52_04275 [Staphylococcus cohnii]|nr:hypothetical protein FOC52_04275 [Staphylococcus cohnii]